MSKTLLLVDDSSVMRAILKRSVQMCGLPIGEFLEASDGQKALDVLRSKTVDVVLADLTMPNMDGFELVEAMATDPALSKVPIIVISSLQSPAGAEQLAARHVPLLKKPVRPEDIRAALDKAFG